MTEDRALAARPVAGTVPGPVRDQVPDKLSGRAKAAVVVRLLLNEGADLPLEELPDDLQARLTQQMGRMGLVDRATLANVVHEFAEALDGVGLSFPKGLAGALSALDGKISPQTAARLRKEAGVRQAGDPWQRLRELPVEDLIEMVNAESVEVAAVLLSKLDVAKAAELLGQLPGPAARRVTYAVSLTGNVTPDAVDRIGLSLAGQLDHRPELAFADAPDARVGAILNESTAQTREDMLSSLDETDNHFAAAVRRNIFTFAHIPARVDIRDVPKVIREADPAKLIMALAAAREGEDKAAAEYLLGNMSKRMAENLREEVGELGDFPEREGEAAMTSIIAAIRRLELAGEITLIRAETEDG